MKTMYTLLAAVMIAVSTLAQSPEKMSYQAVIRNSSNALVSNQAVGMRISILQGSPNGAAVYTENQIPTTNTNGLVSIEIGSGISANDFSAIDWTNGPYFIKTETDPTGGTNFTITGTSQLLSVPYALHATTADSVVGGVLTEEVDGSVTNEIQTISRTGTTVTLSNGGGSFVDSVNSYTAGSNIAISGSNVISVTGVPSSDFCLGQDTLGGIVFYLYVDQNGDQHGLIVNKNESTGQWQSSNTTTNATRTWDGVYNTGLMTNSPAANYVNGLSSGSFTDWYLPSIDELSLLWHNRYTVNKALHGVGGTTLLSTVDYYWSSTEQAAGSAFDFQFNDGQVNSLSKSNSHNLRAIRAF